MTDEIRKLCQRATQELDPAKLLALVQRINELFSEGDAQTKTPRFKPQHCRLLSDSQSVTSHHVLASEDVMACRACKSDNAKPFNGEVAIHFPGLEGLDKPIVWVFPKVSVCLRCGLAEFTVPEREMKVLGEGKPVSRSRNLELLINHQHDPPLATKF